MPLPTRGQVTTSRLEAWDTLPGLPGLAPVVVARMDWDPDARMDGTPGWVLTILPSQVELTHQALALYGAAQQGRYTTAQTEDEARLVLQAAAAATVHALERIRDTREAYKARLEVAARSAGQQSLDL